MKSTPTKLINDYQKFKSTALLIFCISSLLSFSQPVPFNQKYVDSVTLILTALPDDTAKVNVLQTLAAMHLFVNPALTVSYAREGVAISEKINYPIGKISCLGQTAFFYAITGEWAKATMDVNEAIPLCEKYDQKRLIYLYNIMYINAATKGDDLLAMEYAQRALHHPTFLHLSESEKWPTYMQLGRMYAKSDRLDSAIHYANILVDYINKYGSVLPDLAENSNTLIGSIAVRQKDYAKAIRYYRLASYYSGLANVYLTLNQPDSVIYYGVASLRNGEVQKNFDLIQEAAKLLATVYEKSDPEKANVYHKMYSNAKDSLYNNAKLKQLEAVKLNEQKNYFDLEKKQTADRNRLILFSLLALLAFLSIFLLMLWRNNLFKKQANIKLEGAYKNLESTQAQLIQKEKMASLGELTAGVAHEIQNPLNFINNFSDVNSELVDELVQETEKGNIKEVTAIAKTIKANEEKINHHGKRADAIVKGMLQHSRRNSGVKEAVNINSLADEYLRLAYHACLSGEQGLKNKDKSLHVNLETDFDQHIGDTSVIPQDIGSVLVNLYNNAFFAVKEKQKQLQNGYEPRVIVSTKKIADKIEITVRDNGNGIPEKIVDKIFQPFFTTKPTGEGTGLGLSLSYDIIKAHQGEIKINNRPGEGVEFVVSLPMN